MCNKPWGKQDLAQGGKSQASPLPSDPEKFPASDRKGEIKLGSLLHQNKLVVFHDKINWSFFQSSNKLTTGSNNKHHIENTKMAYFGVTTTLASSPILSLAIQ